MLYKYQLAVFMIASLLFSTTGSMNASGNEKNYRMNLFLKRILPAGAFIALATVFFIYLIKKNKAIQKKTVEKKIEILNNESKNDRVQEKNDEFTGRDDVKLQSYDNQAFLDSLSVVQDDIDSFVNHAVLDDIYTEQYYYTKNVKFFYRFSDPYEKRGGWACAWLAIMTCFSSYNIFYTLESLSAKYRRDIKEIEEWAEPGYGKKMLRDAGINAKVFLYNRKKGTPKTNDIDGTIFGFLALTQKFIEHFHTFQTPIMIDDEIYAYTVLGIKKMSNDNVVLWIADPHKTSKKEGLYYLELDGTTGDRISGTDIHIKNEKGWLLLFPEARK